MGELTTILYTQITITATILSLCVVKPSLYKPIRIKKNIRDNIIIQSEAIYTTSKYATDPRVLKYDLIVDNKKYQIRFLIYRGLNDYLSSLSRKITYNTNEPEPTSKDFILKSLNEPAQRSFIEPLVQAIRSASPNKDTQAKLAINLVQNIPFDTNSVANITDKYPYEVLYTNRGVCSEKSELLAYLLRELGYGVAIFYFDSGDIGHAAVGIKCPKKYEYINSGYAFIETTSVFSDSKGLPPLSEIIHICDGSEFTAFTAYPKNNIYKYLQSIILQIKSWRK